MKYQIFFAIVFTTLCRPADVAVARSALLNETATADSDALPGGPSTGNDSLSSSSSPGAGDVDTIILAITVDDVLDELYVDGQSVLVPLLPNAAIWDVIDVIEIPAATQLVTLSAHNDGLVAGILASATGDHFFTNSLTWRCTARTDATPTDWMTESFDDSDWPMAVVVAGNPNWWHGEVDAIISLSAQWIWTSGFLSPAVDRDVLCRGRVVESAATSGSEDEVSHTMTPDDAITDISSTADTPMWLVTQCADGSYTWWGECPRTSSSTTTTTTTTTSAATTTPFIASINTTIDNINKGVENDTTTSRDITTTTQTTTTTTPLRLYTQCADGQWKLVGECPQTTTTELTTIQTQTATSSTATTTSGTSPTTNPAGNETDKDKDEDKEKDKDNDKHKTVMTN